MNTFKPSEDFEYFLTKFGQPFTSKPASEETLNKYRGILPNKLLEYWQTYGFCGFKDGLLWLTNPEEYDDILEEWLPEEKLEKHRFYVIARSGWGELFVWEPTYGNKYAIDPLLGWITEGNSDEDWISEGKTDKALEWFITGQKPTFLDKTNSNEESLFELSVERFGGLSDNEIFTFIPFLFAGGKQELEAVRKVDLFVHYDIVRQMKEPEVLTNRDLLRKGWGI